MSTPVEKSTEPEKIFKAIHDLESLTRDYIEGLLESRESAAAHAQMLTTILDSVADGLIVFDQNQKIILANRAAVRMAGWDISNLPREEFRKRYLAYRDDGVTPLSCEEEPLSIAMRDKRPCEKILFITSEHLPPEGVWVRALASPVIDNNGVLIGGVSMFQDITKDVKVRKQRDILAALITHDLKNHLAAESGFLEIISEDVRDRLDPEVQEVLVDLKADNYRYLQIATTLLELCRTELFSGSHELTDVNIGSVVRKAADLNLSAAKNCSVNLLIDVDDDLPLVKGSLPALERVFHNLIQNAINVSSPGQQVSVGVFKSGNCVDVVVVDQGTGMDDAKVAQLFEAGTAVAAKDIGTHSSGIGLYLSRLVIEAHKGKLSCQSELDKGTIFTVELPT